MTANAVTMIEVFGGLLHCYQGRGGCRKQGLYFSRTEPKKPLRCLLSHGGDSAPTHQGTGTNDRGNPHGSDEIAVSVSRELAPKLEGAVLDFGNFNKMQRFVWLTLPAIKGPSCTCLRSIGIPTGKHSPCLDDQRLGLSDL